MVYLNMERAIAMTIREIVKLLDAKVLLGEGEMERKVYSGCGSDLMSDVLAFVKENTALITGLTNLLVIRTAEMVDINCIIFARGKRPDEEMLKKAEELDLVILSTQKTAYTVCGILFQNGLPGVEVHA